MSEATTATSTPPEVRSPSYHPTPAPQDGGFFSNPFLTISAHAIANKNTAAIKHKTMHQLYGRFPIPANWRDRRAEWYRDGLQMEVSEQLSVIIPCIIAVEGPVPSTDYNWIMTQTYSRWAERAKVYKREKRPEGPGNARSDAYEIPPPAAGVDAQHHYSKNVATFAIEQLWEEDEEFRVLGVDTEEQKAFVGRYCLEEFQRWSDEWREELEAKEELYRQHDGTPPAYTPDDTFA